MRRSCDCPETRNGTYRPYGGAFDRDCRGRAGRALRRAAASSRRAPRHAFRAVRGAAAARLRADPAADRSRGPRRAGACRAHSGARQPARPALRSRAAFRPGRARRSLSRASAASGFGLGVHRAALFNVLFDAVDRCRHSARDGSPRSPASNAPPTVARSLSASRAGKRGRSISSIDALGVRSPLWPLFGGRERRDLRYGALWASLPWPAAGLRSARARAALQRREHHDRRACRSADDAKSVARGSGVLLESSDRRFRGLAYAPASMRGKSRCRALWPEAAPLLDTIRDVGEMTLARYGHHMLARPLANGSSPSATLSTPRARNSGRGRTWRCSTRARCNARFDRRQTAGRAPQLRQPCAVARCSTTRR